MSKYSENNKNHKPRPSDIRATVETATGNLYDIKGASLAYGENVRQGAQAVADGEAHVLYSEDEGDGGETPSREDEEQALKDGAEKVLSDQESVEDQSESEKAADGKATDGKPATEEDKGVAAEDKADAQEAEDQKSTTQKSTAKKTAAKKSGSGS